MRFLSSQAVSGAIGQRTRSGAASSHRASVVRELYAIRDAAAAARALAKFKVCAVRLFYGRALSGICETFIAFGWRAYEGCGDSIPPPAVPR